MSTRPVRLLHVEDNLAHRRLIGHYLNALKEEFKFDIFQADSEAAAVETFRNNGIDFVILDYHLTEGDGLSTLRQLRQLDPLVPIIALSGAATPEIASELLEVGADDYLSKQDLNREALANSVRAALSRKDLVTKIKPPEEQVKLTEKVDQLFMDACRQYVDKLGTGFLKNLDELETAARQAKVTVWQLQRALAAACEQLNARQQQGQPNVDKLLRPLFLETVLRVFGNIPMGNAG
jgi:DNA-binding response OmpR family regulator